jgi:signal peptidase I
VFGPFATANRKMRQNATNWLELATKVEHFRRDVLPAEDLQELQQERERLRTQLKAKAGASDLKLGIESLEGVLRKTGGTFYPKSNLVEYVEFFLVAAIVILGIRAFFFQPFKIPTNSMWPSYNGMTGEVFSDPEEEPGTLAQGFRFLTQLAVPHRIDAPVSGEIRIPVVRGFDETRGQPRDFLKPPGAAKGRKWLIFPTTKRVYEIYVGKTPVKITVPASFDLEKVILDAFFDGAEKFPMPKDLPPRTGVFLGTGKTVKAGERLLSFDVLTGDQLFVDRISYHFVKPSVGDGFVFRTDNIPELHAMMSGPKEQYYIKRLIGTPGDTLEIREPMLYRNGEPIEGSDAFDANAGQEGDYPGYRSLGLLAEGEIFTVSEREYMAIGDNSASSLDGRYWGTVPEKDVVGRPMFIYYPFNSHWGPAP